MWNVLCLTFSPVMVNNKFGFIFAGLNHPAETALPNWIQLAETKSGQVCTKILEAWPGQSQTINCKIR